MYTKIRELFSEDITRYINSVVKVQDDQSKNAMQELKEYVITEQIRQHFKKCFSAYNQYSGKVGYWVSGWFGSGKSHYLKLFGYLLENQVVDGISASEQFLLNDETNELKPLVQETQKYYKTTVVMFDILEQASKENNLVESIEQTVYKQWLIKRGFYAQLLWVGELEKELSDEGKYEAFIENIETLTKKPWNTVRERAKFNEIFIQKALSRAFPENFPTETIAKDYLQSLQKGKSISADFLAKEFLKYVTKLDDQNGRNNRLFLIIDEVGQYISENSKVIGYLQGIETTFDRIGKGKLWIAVSSQNRLEQICEDYLKNADEINKIIDRFEVRMHLTPENLDKVINQRVLKKKADAHKQVEKIYEDNKGKILSILDFNEYNKPLPKFTKEDFINSYPFVPYQIKVVQPIFYNIISTTNVNKKLGGTNRSMIKATQGVLIDEDIDLKEGRVGDLVTFDMIFSQAKDFLDGQLQENIKEAAQLDSEKGQLMVKILRVLFLLDKDDHLKKNKETIAKLLVTNVSTDYSEVLKDVTFCLEKLFKHGYVEKDSNDNYKFISPEEQNFRKEAMRRVEEIGIKDRIRKIKEVIDGIFPVSRINYKNIRPFDVQIISDDEQRTTKGLIKLHLNSTMLSSDAERKKRHLQKSIGDASTIYWYAHSDNTIDEDMTQFLIFDKIISEYRRKWSGDEDKISFLRKEEGKNTILFETIKGKILKSFKNGIYVYFGKEYSISEKKEIKDIFEDIISEAIPKVFYQFNMVGIKINKDDIGSVFDPKLTQLSMLFNELNLVDNALNVNSEAAVLKEILHEVKTIRNRGEQCTGKSLLDAFDNQPYGWDPNAVRLFTALLFRNGNLELNYEGKDFIDYTKPGVKDIFENEPNFRRAVFKEAVVVDAATRQKCQDILKHVFGVECSDTLTELYLKVKDTLIDIRRNLSALKETVLNYKMPLHNELDQLDEILKPIVVSTTQGETVNTFVSKEVDYKPLVEIYTKFNNFKKNGNITEYKKIKDFVETIWPVDSIDNSEEALSKYNALSVELGNKTFIDSWGHIRNLHSELYTPYKNEYISTHNKLNLLYGESIKKIKETSSFNKLKKDLERLEVVKILKDKTCSYTDDPESIPCSKCRAYIKDMKTLIDAVEIYYDQAIAKSYEMYSKQLLEEPIGPTGTTPKPPETVKVTYNVSKHSQGRLLMNHADVKKYIKSLEAKLMEEIEKGHTIILE
ncbi:BREX system P-loop protein BrxC [Ruminiclostridium cellobioparum]|uniref:BREX system P-loop protein BrxC n=1 Tax=Ruminiclostridium cellobioparum TaxID=29355 RepID=UPI0028ACE3B3|nr:BREX system P-loop protein BrxC [Ruminiclostridium cellobioparum]